MIIIVYLLHAQKHVRTHTHTRTYRKREWEREKTNSQACTHTHTRTHAHTHTCTHAHMHTRHTQIHMQQTHTYALTYLKFKMMTPATITSSVSYESCINVTWLINMWLYLRSKPIISAPSTSSGLISTPFSLRKWTESAPDIYHGHLYLIIITIMFSTSSSLDVLMWWSACDRSPHTFPVSISQEAPPLSSLQYINAYEYNSHKCFQMTMIYTHARSCTH